VAIESLSAGRHEPAPDRELVIDYGHHDSLELRSAIRTVARAIGTARSVGGAGRPMPLPTAKVRLLDHPAV